MFPTIPVTYELKRQIENLADGLVAQREFNTCFASSKVPLIPCQSVNIGSVTLDGTRTIIAVSLFDDDFSAFYTHFKHADTTDRLYEIRYDLFRKRSGAELQKLIDFLNESGINYIFTFRSEDPDLVAEYYGIASDSGVPCADVDVSVSDTVWALGKYRSLILSYHSFSGESVVEPYEKILQYSPNIIKVASSYTGLEQFQNDLTKLQGLKNRDHKCLSFIPMGRSNSFLRVLSAYIVSDIVYARSADETAEGQLSEEEYRSFFSLF